MPTLPTFKYHPDPVRSGSVEPSDGECDVCGEARGYRYTGPIYVDGDDPELCPWCIADGSAARELGAEFVDCEAFGEDVPEAAIEEITTRTPGYAAWQTEVWPDCCGDAAVFDFPIGIAEIRSGDRELREMEGQLIGHVIEQGISGGAATRLVESLHVGKGPTAYVFHCPTCRRRHFHIDRP